MIRSLLIITGLFITTWTWSQKIIEIKNSSFEDIPHRGQNNKSVKDWFDCGLMNFPSESPPDIHPGNFWDVNVPPSEGNTYLGMVVRDNESWESISQRLSTNISADQCYSINIDLARSQVYQSASRILVNQKGEPKPTNYITPTVLRVWGGSGFCDCRELLAESTPITHQNWETYEFKFKPKFSHTFIVIEAYYKTPVLFPYCGHLLLDNLSNIQEISCTKEEEEDIAVVAPTKPKTQALPPHKRNRVEEAKKKTQTDIAQADQSTAPAKKEKILKDLDIKKLKQGSTLEIKNLYFPADSTNVTPSSHLVLDEIYEFLIENKNVVVEIGGHTNRQPKHEYCDKLSTERAKSVYNYLIEKGVPRQALTYKGYGKRRPLSTANTPESRKKNQRVEIKILSLG